MIEKKEEEIKKTNSKNASQFNALNKKINELMEKYNNEIQILKKDKKDMIEEQGKTNKELNVIKDDLKKTNQELNMIKEEIKKTNQEFRITIEELKKTNQELNKTNQKLKKKRRS